MRGKVDSRLKIQGELIHTLYRTGKKTNAKKFILDRLESSFKDIEKAYIALSEGIERKEHYPKGADWLLDNFYFIELTYKKLRNAIKKERNIILNIANKDIYKGYPRVYALAVELINHSKGNITEDGLIDFVNQFQKEEVLSLDEVAFFPSFIILGLIEYIKNISSNLLDVKLKWKEADSLDISSDEAIERIIEEIPRMESTKIDGIVRRIREEREDYHNVIERIDENWIM